MKFLVGKIGTLLLAVWLLLTGLIPLLNLTLPDLLLPIIAIVAGVFILLEIRREPTQNLGRLVLAIFLIVMGVTLLNVPILTKEAKDMVVAVLAIIAGVLLLLGR